MFRDLIYDAMAAYGNEYDLVVAGGDGIAVSGDAGISIVGRGGIAKAGEDGILIFLDDTRGERVACVAYVGSNGIEPDQFYEFDGSSVVISSFDA